MVVTDLPFASLDRRDAGSGGVAVEMDRAGAAGGHSAAEFRAGEPEHVAQVPEHRHRWIAVEGLRLAVHAQRDHVLPPCGKRLPEVVPPSVAGAHPFPVTAAKQY